MTTEQLHPIAIPGFPKGWKALVYGWPKNGVDYVFDGIGVKLYTGKEDHAMIIVEKIKPHRIVLEDTGEVRQPKEGEYVFNNGNLCLCRKPERWGNEHQIWRLVKEE